MIYTTLSDKAFCFVIREMLRHLGAMSFPQNFKETAKKWRTGEGSDSTSTITFLLLTVCLRAS